MRVRDPGDLVASIPALLGFHPRQSVVLVSLSGAGGRTVGLVVRGDLPEPVPRLGTGAEALVDAVMLDEPTAVVVAVISSAPQGPGGAPPPEHAQLVEVIAAELARRGTRLHSSVWAAATQAGSPWACYDPCMCSGAVAPGASHGFTAGAAVAGTVVHGDRAALRELVAPVHDTVVRRRERLLAELVGAAARTGAEPAPPVVSDAGAGIELVESAIAEAAAGRLRLDDHRVVALVTAIAIPAVRDHAIDMAAAQGCSEVTAAAAEQLWAALCREAPAPEAAEPATLLAVAALLRGDGAMANVALDRADEAWPGHLLARLLRDVVDLGMVPEHFREAISGRGEPQ